MHFVGFRMLNALPAISIARLRLTALTFGLSLLAFMGSVAAQGNDQASGQAPSLREVYRAKLNENLVTIVAGSPSGTDLNIAYDIAEVLDDGDNLRVLPMVGKGGAQNVRDVLFLKGVDMGITQANILKYFNRTGELAPNLDQRIAYVAKLFNEEIHIIARSDITKIEQLEGRVVNFGEAGSGSELTARLLFEALGLQVQEVNMGEADAIEDLKAGKIAATVVMAGKPAPALAGLNGAEGLRLVPVPYVRALENDYYPASLTHDDYPNLISEGETIDTVSVCAVLVTFNWNEGNPRYKKVARFVDAFFTNFDKFLQAPRHPKWREVNFAATLEGWQRSPAAQRWIDRAKQPTETTARFETFLGQTAAVASTKLSDTERANLFRAFLEWNKKQESDQQP
jgi:uncharacterized protein